MKKEFTQRGFGIINFQDAYKQNCSIQESSLVAPHIWLGVDDTGDELTGVNGKHNCENNRMHLNREQALELIPYLIGFVKSGELKKAKKWEFSNGLTKKQFLKEINK